jgi:hypothetical protein
MELPGSGREKMPSLLTSSKHSHQDKRPVCQEPLFACFFERILYIVGAESIDRRHFTCNVMFDPLATSYVEIFFPPVALTAMVFVWFGSDEPNFFFICSALNCRNFCLCFLEEVRN